MAIDLTSTFFNIVQEQTDFGQAINVEFTVKNDGDMDVDPFSLDIFLRPNTNIGDLNDESYQLGTYDIVTGLKAGEEVTKTFKYSTPAADNPFWVGEGTYYAGLFIDPDFEIDETDLFNNYTGGSSADFQVFYDSYEVVDYGPSDLAASSIDVGGSGLQPGDHVPLTFTVENLDQTNPAHPFSIDIYLNSTQGSFDPDSDLKLGFYDIREVLDPGTGVTKSYTYTLPGVDDAVWDAIGDGTHYIHLDVDPTNEVEEFDDGNNSGQGLGFDSVSFDVSGINDAPDLVVSHFSAPDSFNAGDTISVDYEIANIGGLDAESLAAGFYITTTDYLASGEPVGVDDVPGILFLQGDLDSSLFDVAAGASTGIMTTDLTIPEGWGGFSGDGEYVIGAIADVFDDVTEGDENNNSNNIADQDYQTVSIAAPDNTGAVDLEGSYFELGTDEIEAGGEVDLSFEVANKDIGHVGTFDIDLYLSHDENISADEDYYLGTYTIVDGIIGQTDTGVKSFTYHAPEAGDPFWQGGDAPYYAGMIIDPENLVAETDETNNSNFGEGLDFASTPKVADLMSKSLEIVGDTDTFSAGDTIEVQYEIMNEGTGAAEDFAAGFYLFDDEYATSNEELSIDDVPEVFFLQGDQASSLISLEAGESTGMVTTELTLPQEWDGYLNASGGLNLGVAADPYQDVDESNELNNSLNGAGVDYQEIFITSDNVA
ncbi:CARDB domain-containing protein [Pleurocapsa sp. PCC 7319]|uniref:CARDB domain-containing protein n=1 Tax=Pleurocapsa sp. PCC 7319 TaxID=118161 RepID=UPI00130EE9D3|nr:CARDB domain-containing protein [Pleurocapsa sp. PCC 7319]